MLPDRVSNPGPLTYESGALPIALRGPALKFYCRVDPGKYGRNLHIEFSRTIVLSVPAVQHRVPVFRFILCLL